jgi:hypothetical protein
MANINWTDYEEPGAFKQLEPGIYSVTVTKCVERQSKSGDTMFDLTLESTQFQKTLCYDVIMLEGRGKNMGLAKLKQMGFAERTELMDLDLEGAKLIVKVEMGGYTKADGTEVKRLEVAMDFDDPFRAGYAPKEAYNELEPQLMKADEVDTPF